MTTPDIIHFRRLLSWISNGIYYGYPTCCIAEFLKEGSCVMRGMDRTRWPAAFLDQGTGFIACAHCSDAKSETTLVAEINATRFAPDPFPSEPDRDSPGLVSFLTHAGTYLTPTRVRAHGNDLAELIDGMRQYQRIHMPRPEVA